jgi:DNA-binding XRE family transcriptional regulator
MAQRTRKADNPALRADVEQLRRMGPLSLSDVNELAARHDTTAGTVRVVRAEIGRQLAAEAAAAPRRGGRTVTEFSGSQLRDYRVHARLMQDELAKMAKVSRGEIGHLERGHRKPTLKTLRNLETALGTPPGALLDGYDGPAPADQPAREAAR